jgi:hypothetical protein
MLNIEKNRKQNETYYAVTSVVGVYPKLSGICCAITISHRFTTRKKLHANTTTANECSEVVDDVSGSILIHADADDDECHDMNGCETDRCLRAESMGGNIGIRLYGNVLLLLLLLLFRNVEGYCNDDVDDCSLTNTITKNCSSIRRNNEK